VYTAQRIVSSPETDDADNPQPAHCYSNATVCHASSSSSSSNNSLCASLAVTFPHKLRFPSIWTPAHTDKTFVAEVHVFTSIHATQTSCVVRSCSIVLNVCNMLSHHLAFITRMFASPVTINMTSLQSSWRPYKTRIYIIQSYSEQVADWTTRGLADAAKITKTKPDVRYLPR